MQTAGYVARSAYKLLEMQERYKLVRRGSRVLDLGCVPGAWLQVACQNLGPRSAGGMVLGIDIQVSRKGGGGGGHDMNYRQTRCNALKQVYQSATVLSDLYSALNVASKQRYRLDIAMIASLS